MYLLGYVYCMLCCKISAEEWEKNKPIEETVLVIEQGEE